MVKKHVSCLTSFYLWFPFAMVITLLCGLFYVTMQQNYRQNANDPQIQLAQDVARLLTQGQSPAGIENERKIDIETSLSSYIIIFDTKGVPLFSNALLQGQKPQLPLGVFDYTKVHKEDRFTWQPRAGVRSAVVLLPFEGQQPGFVAVGRSLREVEKRINQLTLMVALGWIVTMASSFIAVFILKKQPFFSKT